MRRIVLLIAASVLALGTYSVAQNATTILPNSWRITAPLGAVATVGTLPTGIALSRDGGSLFVLDTGWGKTPDLRVLDAHTLATKRTVNFPNAFGIPLRDANGDGVWIAGTSTFQEQIAHVDTAGGNVDRTISLPVPFAPTALARSADGTLLAVTGDIPNRIAIIDLARGAIVHNVGVGRHPGAVVFSADGHTLYVAARAESTVYAIDVARGTVRRTIAVGRHPDAFALGRSALYVANADDDSVAAIDLATEHVTRAPLPIAISVYGDSPNNLALDGDRLYVSCGAANAIAVYRVTAGGGLTPLGAIPTGWYPTALAVDHATHVLYIANGKGEGGHANPQFRPGAEGQSGYIAGNLVGSIRAIPIPDDAGLHAGLAQVRELAQHVVAHDDPVLRPQGPITHVIYVIKENRTYDQVLGDVAAADGDPSLVMFGQNVTPNQHAIVSRFGIFDRFFDNAHVSADGHNWSMGALANDYLEKMWPPQYSSRRAFYDFEDGAEASRPHDGYLWDLAARSHVALRNYGEFMSEGPEHGLPVSTTSTTLEHETDLNYPTFDLKIRDVDRFTEWKHEFDAYESTHTLPALEIVRFPDDHTAGTKSGELTPQAMVADNDLAVGRLVDAVSHSADWAHTAIFILEDDAQNGPDHVDEQRSTFYLASPYARGGVVHERYTTVSVLRTIEILLGMPPLTTYDAGAMPLYDAFTATPNLTPFDALPATTDVDAKNSRIAYGAAQSASLDFAREDQVPDGVLNDILWHAVRGANAPTPRFGEFTSGS
jgi:YVTN family beta-propeller protein